MFNNKTITLYNRHFDEVTEEEQYFINVIQNVDIKDTKGANISASGTSDINRCTVYIPFSSLPKPFKSKKEWINSTTEEKEKYITFNDEGDFFAIGEVIVESSSNLFNKMRQLYDVQKVSTVDIYPDVLPHFEIGGK